MDAQNNSPSSQERPMANTNPSHGIDAMLVQLERHEAFLKTPEGQAWKRIRDNTVDYLDVLPPPSNSERLKELFVRMQDMAKDISLPPIIKTELDNMAAGGFKRGELCILPQLIRPSIENKSALAFMTYLKQREVDPNFKPVVHISMEMDLEGMMRRLRTHPNKGNTT